MPDSNTTPLSTRVNAGFTALANALKNIKGNYLPLAGGNLKGNVTNSATYYKTIGSVDLSATSTNSRENTAFQINRNPTDTTNTSGNIAQIHIGQPSNSQNLEVGIRVANPRGGNLPTSGTNVLTSNCWDKIGLRYNYSLNRAYAYTSNPPVLDESDNRYYANHLATVGNLKSAVTSAVASYLPLAGGIMTGMIQNTGSNGIVSKNDDHIGHWAGTSTSLNWNDRGASLQFYSKNHSTSSGHFILAAYDGTTEKALRGRPDGILTWANGDIYVANKQNITTYGDAITRSGTANWLRLTGGETPYTDGASLILYGKTHATEAGTFNISAYDGTTRRSLTGRVDGNLQWNGAKVATVPDLANYLPLSGGWMTNAVRRNVTNLTKGTKPSGNSYTYDNYASINSSTSGVDRLGGWFHYIDTNMNSIIYMQAYGFASGSSTTANVRARVNSDNSTYIDLNAQNIITGASYAFRNVANSFLALHGGVSSDAKAGAYISLSGKDRTTYGGTFRISCTDGSSQQLLIGAINSLTWNGAVPAVSDDSTKIATTAYVKDCVPKSIGSATKPVYTNSNGVVTASSSTVGSATNPVYLNAGTITATGGTWIKSSAASLATKGYIQFSNGLMLNWGYDNKTSNTQEVTFAKAFTTACYGAFCSPIRGIGNDGAGYVTKVTTTGCTLHKDSSQAYFFAIGK